MKTSLPHYFSKLSTLSRKHWLLFLLLVTVLLPHKLLADAYIYEGYIILNPRGVENTYYDLNPSVTTGNPDFNGVNFGVFTTDETFTLRGAEAKLLKNGGCDVYAARIRYRVYLANTPESELPGIPFCSVAFPLVQDFADDGITRYQKWYENRGVVNLLEGRLPGNYVVEVYLEADYQRCGSGSGLGTNYYSNSARNYKAQFTIEQGNQKVTVNNSCPLRPLPVTLTRFDAKRQDANTLLSWETASEQHSRGYEVQVSTDGRTFRALGFVQSQSEGAQVSRRTYTYIDTEKGKSGVRYYRLRQIDFDGKEGTYGPQVVSFGKANALAALEVAPNPFSSGVTLTLPAQEGTRSGTVVVTDMVGRTVFNQPLLLNAGTSQVQLPELSSLPKGLYHLRLSLNGEQQAVKLLKE